ncbi:MAG: hypothetical protein FWB86_11655 [Treponema sp.]|nr:hypothetical protein [Treponema sp.]MCL2252544.1 hypothetical protein [Treponema sp.]
MLKLNNLFDDYLLGEISRYDFEGFIYHFLLNNQEKTCLAHWKRYEYDDFLSWFYPRLQQAIEMYQDIGASFEAFFSKYILISSKEYRNEITSCEIIEYSTWSSQVSELYAHEEPAFYLEKNAEKIIKDLIIDKQGRKNTRRILSLIIKCYYYISDDFAEKVAPKIGIKSEELLEMLKKIRSIRQKKDDDIYNMKERIYSQFFRCQIYERNLLYFKENESLYNKKKLQLKKARKRLASMRKRLASIRKEATNDQVAEIIGVTKGTVDASLYRLKIKWTKMVKNAHLN